METLNKRSWWETATRTVFVMVLGAFIGLLLMYLVYLIPTAAMKDNVTSSYLTLAKEGEYHSLCPELLGETGKKDNFTDGIMISTSYFNDPNYSALERSMLTERYGAGVYGLGSLLGFNDDTYAGVYARYWHGYLVVLRPLLMVMNLSQIRIFNIIFQTLLVGFVVFLMFKKCKGLIVPYILSLLTISPYTISQNLQFVDIYLIFNISLAVILIFYEKLEKRNNLIFLFLIIGMLTSFFDLLTYPIATLGVPLVAVFYLKRHDDETFKQKILYFVKLCVFWGIGYAGFMVTKWLLASIILNQNIFVDAINQLLVRTGGTNAEGGEVSWLMLHLAFIFNIGTFFCLKNIIIIGVYVAAMVVLLIVFRKKLNLEWKNILLVLVISLLPIAWQLVVSNHSFVHRFFTFRAFVVSVFAIMTIFSLIFEKLKEKKEKVQNGQNCCDNTVLQ